MNCQHCGQPVVPGGKFCVGCGTAVAAGSSTGSGQPGSQAGALTIGNTKISLDWKTLKPYYIGGGALVIYSSLTRNPSALIAGIALAAVTRLLAAPLDKVLSPVWAVRDHLPRKLRLVLGWGLPFLFSYYVATTPAIFQNLDWVPISDPDARTVIFTMTLSTVVSFLLVREPGGAR